MVSQTFGFAHCSTLPASAMKPSGAAVMAPRVGGFPALGLERAGSSAIQLLLERVNTSQGAVEVLREHTIEGVQLRGKMAAPWWQTHQGRSYVLGKELVSHAAAVEKSAAAAGPTDPGAYHVFCKLDDLDSFTMSVGGATRTLHRHTDGPGGRAPASALSSQLSMLALEGASPPGGPATPDQGDRLGAFTRRASAPTLGTLDLAPTRGGFRPDNTVVHLVVRRSCKIGRHVRKGEFELSVEVPASETAEAVLRKLEAESGLEGSSHRLLYNGEELTDKSLAEYRVPDGAVLELVPYEPASEPASPLCLSRSSLHSPQHGLFQGWQAAQKGLKNGQLPKLANAGSGGSYFINDDKGTPCAVFKPADEEPLALHNPRASSLYSSGTGSSGDSPTSGLRNGVYPGEGAAREVAAFVLDHDHFARVPPTALVSCQETTIVPSPRGPGLAAGKVGSLQQFVEAQGDCEELGVGQFPVGDVQRIACLDMRLANTDRNASNILARRLPGGGWQLVPIDHAYCLPSSFEDLKFDWLYWPQAAKPWVPEAVEYIARLDPEADLQLLTAHNLPLRPDCRRVFRVTTSLLKKGAARGFTAAAIGELMCRPEDETPSKLEELHANALAKVAGAAPGEVDAAYLAHMEAQLDTLLDQAALDELAWGHMPSPLRP